MNAPPLEVADWESLAGPERAALLARPVAARSRAVAAQVRRIVTAVRRGGDAALARWTERLDGARLADFEVGEAEAGAAEAALAPEARSALDRAAAAIAAFHAAQRRPPVRVETAPGVVCERVERPIERVGLYVPAGGAPLASTALMLTIPARLAGCAERVVATPPRRDGSADPAIVAAARRGGATRILKLGGAPAIAALAFGSESVARVDKILGPGNAWVAEAKRQVALDPEGPAVDAPAGPSEIFVVADASAEPAWLAADLLAQAEHAADAQVLLASDDGAFVRAVAVEIERQAARLPRRDCGAIRLILAPSLEAAFAIAARYAPEHLLVAVAEPGRWRDRIGPAGAVYLGAHAAASLGDYATGANHVLPTGGAARAAGGLGLADFVRATTFQSIAREGLSALAPTAVALARLERLEAHARSVEIRLAPTGAPVPDEVPA